MPAHKNMAFCTYSNYGLKLPPSPHPIAIKCPQTFNSSPTANLLVLLGPLSCPIGNNNKEQEEYHVVTVCTCTCRSGILANLAGLLKLHPQIQGFKIKTIISRFTKFKPTRIAYLVNSPKNFFLQNMVIKNITVCNSYSFL